MPGETRFGVFGCVLYLVGIVCPPFEISVAQKHGEKSDATRSELHRDVSVQIASKLCAKDKTCCRCHNEYLPVKLLQKIG